MAQRRDASRAQRYQAFDALPKALRDAINYADIPPPTLLVWRKFHAGQKLETILRFINNASLEKVARNPVERDLADAFLKDLGL